MLKAMAYIAGILAGLATFTLSTLQILQSYMGIDVRAMLLGWGNAIGQFLAASDAWFGHAIAHIAGDSAVHQLLLNIMGGAVGALLFFPGAVGFVRRAIGLVLPRAERPGLRRKD